MFSRNDRRRRIIQIESLEGRNAPSRFGALAVHVAEQHHNRHGRPAGGHHEVRALRRGGHDDPANHNQNDLPGRDGHDDPANHDQNDDRGALLGNDDPANHDQNDDRGALQGNDDTANHDRNDDRGRDGGGHR